MSPPFDTLHRDNAWLCSLPPSEGRPGIDATVLLCRDDCQLRNLGKVICHFFRKGKLGLKLAIKIPFFVEIEISFETDWSRRR